MLTKAWFPLRRTEPQHALWRTRARFVAVAAGRGSGKTELARRRVARFLSVRKSWPDPIYFYALPTYAQAKRVAWKPLKRLIPREWIKKISETELTIETVFGSTLYVMGMDTPARAEGLQWDGGVIDESCDQKPGIFDLTFLPAFSHRSGWCWRIGVPKRHGIGATEFRAVFDRGLSGEEPDAASFAWPSSDILTPEQLRYARQTMDPLDYAEQYDASWQTIGGSIFHAFSKSENVTPDVAYLPELPIIVSSDFNVNPMCWVLGHKLNDHFMVFDEIVLRNTNTQRTLDHLYQRYGQHQAGFVFCGDATGRARKTSASASDYLQILNDKRFVNKRVLYPRSNPAIVDRFAACNALLKNAEDQRRCFIHPRCQRLIADLENRGWREGSHEPDDGGDLGHASDAWGYAVVVLFPMKMLTGDDVPQVHVTST